MQVNSFYRYSDGTPHKIRARYSARASSVALKTGTFVSADWTRVTANPTAETEPEVGLITQSQQGIWLLQRRSEMAFVPAQLS